MAPREALSAGLSTVRGRPLDYVRTWTGYRARGMSRWHDLVDWVGGYPFEVAAPEQVFDFVSARGFTLERLKTCGGGLGCNQFVFARAGCQTRADRPIRGLGTVVGDLVSVAGARLATFVLGLAGAVATTHLLIPADYAVITYMSLGDDAHAHRRLRLEQRGRRPLRARGARAIGRACGACSGRRVAVTLPILAAATVLLVALEAAGVLPPEFTWPFVWLTLAIGILGVACDQMIVALEAFGRMRAGARARRAAAGHAVRRPASRSSSGQPRVRRRRSRC